MFPRFFEIAKKRKKTKQKEIKKQKRNTKKRGVTDLPLKMVPAHYHSQNLKKKPYDMVMS